MDHTASLPVPPSRGLRHVLVVGAGGADLAAALLARQAGAQVSLGNGSDNIGGAPALHSMLNGCMLQESKQKREATSPTSDTGTLDPASGAVMRTLHLFTGDFH